MGARRPLGGSAAGHSSRAYVICLVARGTSRACTYDRRVAGGEPDEMIRVFVVDDHGVVRRGIRSYLAIFDDILVVGEAGDGAEALARLRALEAEDALPHVVLMDLAMQPVDGVSATREVRETLPDVEVVAVTSLIDQSRVEAALQA